MSGRRKRGDIAFQTFAGLGASSGLELELAPRSESGFAGVFPTQSGKWQAVVRVEIDGQKVRRTVGSSFESAEAAAVQRALAIKGYVKVLSPVKRADRGTGTLATHHPSVLPV